MRKTDSDSIHVLSTLCRLLTSALFLLPLVSASELLKLPGGGLLSHPRPAAGDSLPRLHEMDSLLVNGHLGSAHHVIRINGQQPRRTEDGRFAGQLVWPQDRLLTVEVETDGGVLGEKLLIGRPRSSSSGALRLPPSQLPQLAIFGENAVISTARGGSYWLFPQSGAQARVTEMAGRWLELELGPGLKGWTTRKRLQELADFPEQEAAARKLGPRLQSRQLENGDLLIDIPIAGSASPIWNSILGPDLRTLDLRIWNCVSHIDWLRLDPDAGLLHMNWEPAPDASLMLTFHLEEGRYLGHGVSWNEGLLKLRFRARPRSLKELRVLLDPGHGGSQSGCVGASGVREADLALELAFKLKLELEKKGSRVFLSRNRDEKLGLYERVELADSLDVDLFLSLHYDSVGERDDPWSAPGSSMFYWSAWSAPAARILHDVWQRRLKMEDRGLHQRSLAVTRQHQRAALLLEAGTLIHPAEEGLLLDHRFQKKQARALRKGIEAWLAQD